MNPVNINSYLNPITMNGLTPGDPFNLPAATLYTDSSVTFNAPGTSGRDIIRGPGSSNLDFAIFKNFTLKESMVL